ncbi:MAG: hypothetical protein K1X51_17975 [Rhodospirillaceae bacterium]|nr:hypothetical protein [Rhodospirillaceae bacterium]
MTVESGVGRDIYDTRSVAAAWWLNLQCASIATSGRDLSRKPSGSARDDEAFEPGSIYENNELMEDRLKGHAGWSMLDVHSDLYMPGTNFAPSDKWF